MSPTYAIVPVEPDSAMLDRFVSRALCVSVSGEGGWTRYAQGQWATMLEAAPLLPDALLEHMARAMRWSVNRAGVCPSMGQRMEMAQAALTALQTYTHEVAMSPTDGEA